LCYARADPNRCVVAMKRVGFALVLTFTAVTVVPPFALQNCVDGRERQHAMDVNAIKAELGTVVGQLLEYQFQPVPQSQQRKGQRSAATSAKGWVESIIVDSFQPHENVPAGFHNRDQGTCDAVEFHYYVGVGAGQLDLRIRQTIFVLNISVKPKVWHSTWQGRPERAATELSSRLFLHPDRLNLRRIKASSALTFGDQIISAAKSSDEIDWLDTLRWWSDGTEVGFTVLKRTGAGQAYVTSLDLQPNQVWFDMFERPRAR